uniref:Uncharacterized protein n=1 Tax=Arundo donax TaxID=35708 RepID=A0A0A9B3I1_ARUDO
MGALRMRKLEI